LRTIAENTIWFTGTVVLGAMFAFLAPLPAHKPVRVVFGILCVLVVVFVVNGALETTPVELFAEKYAPFVALVLGLAVCIAFFERLKDLIGLMGAAKGG